MKPELYWSLSGLVGRPFLEQIVIIIRISSAADVVGKDHTTSALSSSCTHYQMVNARHKKNRLFLRALGFSS